MKTPATHDAIGPDTGSHGIQTGGKGGRNPDAFTLFGDRSTATRAGASRGRQDHRLHTTLRKGGGDLSADALHGIQAAKIAHGDKQVVQ